MATLKISDLSVGDWVGLEAADLTIAHCDIATAFVEVVRKPICVQSILGEDKLVFASIESIKGYETIYTKEEYLRPIPITPEILAANGFTKWQGGLVLISDEVSCRYEDDNLSIEQVYRDDEGVFVERLLVNPSCKAVHQLQHALRLAGVEKEIVML